MAQILLGIDEKAFVTLLKKDFNAEAQRRKQNQIAAKDLLSQKPQFSKTSKRLSTFSAPLRLCVKIRPFFRGSHS
jgi:hypothetical protein